MPRGDRSGPRGMGPMTGRAAGYCAGYATPGYMNPGPGARGGFGGQGYGPGYGGGGGYGRGWRHRNWYNATGQPGWMRFGAAPGWAPPVPVSPEASGEAEVQFLSQQADWLKSQLENIQGRLNDLEENAAEE